jgi:hypothetical protein
VDSELELKIDCDLEISLVNDAELLYRRIFSCTTDSHNKHYELIEGKIKFSKIAFSDRGLKPSVDRACLHGYEPTKTQSEKTDGVIGLIVQNVRAIDDLSSSDSKGKITAFYKIDVIHRPKPENKAHTQIEPSPDYSSASVFKRLQQRLARLADERLAKYGWEIKPDGLN